MKAMYVFNGEPKYYYRKNQIVGVVFSPTLSIEKYYKGDNHIKKDLAEAFCHKADVRGYIKNEYYAKRHMISTVYDKNNNILKKIFYNNDEVMYEKKFY